MTGIGSGRTGAQGLSEADQGAAAAVTFAAASAGMSGFGASAAAALTTGKLGALDPSVNGFLANALKGIVDGLQMTTSSPRPSFSAATQPVRLGAVTFGAFSGGL